MSLKILELRQVAEIVTGSTPPTSMTEYYGGTIPFITPGDLDSPDPIVQTKAGLTTKGAQVSRILPPFSVLVSCIGTLGKVGITGVEAVSNQQINALVFDTKIVDSRYGFHFARTLRTILSASATATTLPIVNKSRFSSLAIPVPPLAEQRRIAAILDRADAIRRKRKQAIALTEQLLRSTFLEMFGDPVTNPKAWPMTTVGDLTTAIKDGPHVSPQYAPNGIPFISTRNIRPGKLLLHDMKYLSEADYLELTRNFRPQKGDVLLTKGGTTGFAKVVDWDWPFGVWVHLAILRPQPHVLPEYLEAALNSPNCYAQSQHYTRGIANRDLGLSRIAKIQMAIPPIKLQQSYRSFQQRLQIAIANQEVGVRHNESLVSGLVSASFAQGTK